VRDLARWRTFLVMLFKRLVVLSSQLGPPREIVLGADGGHFALKAHHLVAEADLGLEVL
jgi:hypothetical protein